MIGQQQQRMQSLGDTSLTKVFVGGLAWETQQEALREHFEQYGEILEAVVISDKITARSKGYGFVTFKDPEAAKKACEDPTPTINGRRANCNLASMGARRRPSPPATPPPSHQPGMGVNVPGGMANGPPPQAAWYYHPPGPPPPPPSPYHRRHHYPRVLPVYPAPAASYRYSPSYMTETAYNAPAKMNHPQGQFAYPGQGGMVAASNTVMPVYPMYYHHHPAQSMGVPAAHFFPRATTAMSTGAVVSMSPIISKPAAVAPATVCVAVEQATSCS